MLLQLSNKVILRVKIHKYPLFFLEYVFYKGSIRRVRTFSIVTRLNVQSRSFFLRFIASLVLFYNHYY